MSKITQAQEFITKAQQIQQGATGKYRAFQDQFVSGKARIDKILNTVARSGQDSSAMHTMMYDVYYRKQTRELMHIVRDQKSQYRQALSEAKKLAEDVLYSGVKRPEQSVVDRFERRLADLKTEIQLSTAQKGRDILRSFMDSISGEPYMADRLRAEYGNLVTPILAEAGPDAGRIKLELAQAFEATKQASLTDEARQAVQVIEASDAMLQSNVMPLAVEQHVNEHLGRRVADFVQRPEEWFASNPDAEKLAPGQLNEEEVMVDSVIGMQERAAAYVPYQDLPKPGGILPPSPFDRE